MPNASFDPGDVIPATRKRRQSVNGAPYTPGKGEVHMIAVITGSLAVVLIVTIVRWIAAIPLLQAISASIDEWADDLHGQDSAAGL